MFREAEAARRTITRNSGPTLGQKLSEEAKLLMASTELYLCRPLTVWKDSCRLCCQGRGRGRGKAGIIKRGILCLSVVLSCVRAEQ